MAAHTAYQARLDRCWAGEIVERPGPGHPSKVLGLDERGMSVRPWGGTDNYESMLIASWLWRVLAQGAAADPAERHEAFRLASMLYDQEEKVGMWRTECTCPSPHDEMHLMSHLTVAAAASRWRRPKLLSMSIASVGRALRLYRLTMAPDGEPYMGGARTKTATPRRHGAAAVMRELLGLPHRTERGSTTMTIEGKKVAVTADTLGRGVEADYFRPLRWLRALLDERPALRDQLLDLGERGPLPRLRYPATLYRTEGGLLWVHDRPADPPRHLLGEFCDWVRVEWGKPGQHLVEVGKGWATPAPPAPKGARAVRIGVR
jgi:hypothetical protein